VDLLAPWREGPYTLQEALERYGEALVGEALRQRVLKPVMTRLGPVLVPAARGRALLGLTRYYTPRAGALEMALLVRRQAEAMEREGWRMLKRQGSRAVLEKDGERVLVVGNRGPVGRRPRPQDDLEATASRVVVLVPEGAKRSRIEVKEVRIGSG